MGVDRGLGAALGEIPAASAGMTEFGGAEMTGKRARDGGLMGTGMTEEAARGRFPLRAGMTGKRGEYDGKKGRV